MQFTLKYNQFQIQKHMEWDNNVKLSIHWMDVII